MPTTRKVLRIFLASPGDLEEERIAIRDIVLEINESWANPLGYHIDLVAWEETVAGYGRPQHLINKDLDQCDLFIGMIWKRWGTPPDSDSQFTSGFQEEFERSLARREQSESPEISLYFKNIPNEFMVDPGNDLKRVLEFREQIINEKKILFQTFSSVKEMEGLARRCISNFIINAKTADGPSELDEGKVKRSESESEKVQSEKVSPEDSPLSAEGLAFLEQLVDILSQGGAIDDLNSSDIARFRLLANSISKPGNEDLDLGVHDANILFSAYANGMKLGKREIRCLVKLGFQYLGDEVVPLWRWYSATSSRRFDEAIFSSLTGTTDEEKIGAIRVLDALSRDLPEDDEPIKKEWLIDNWFSDKSSTPVRSAALAYLANKGTRQEYHIAKKEYDRNEHGTTLPALECMVRILLRTGQEREAQQLVIESQFESLDSDTLQEVLNGFDSLETELLLLGSEHRNAQIRHRTLGVLICQDVLEHNKIEGLLGDSDASIRNEAVMALETLGRPLKEEEIYKILVQPKKQQGSGMFGGLLGSDRDIKGEDLFRRYKLVRLKNLTEAELTKKILASLIHDDDAYFARAEKYFTRHADELRRDVDDNFNAYFQERIQRLKSILINNSDSETLIESTRNMEDFSRKKLTRQGLDILCARGNAEDLKRIRDNLGTGYAGTSIEDVEYMRKRGERIDIPPLVYADAPNVGLGQGLTNYIDFQDKVAEAVLSMWRGHSISLLFSLELPDIILIKTIKNCSVSRFSTISDNVLLELFDHEAEDVRKAACIMAVRALSTKRIRVILNEYVNSDKYRYYNVIHWLDLGASMSRDEARKVALALSG